MNLRRWRSHNRRTLITNEPWLTAGEETWELPDGRQVEHFNWVQTTDWITVAAITEAGQVVLERCFKPGYGRVALTLPAGALNASEEPEAAARRELLEETGYVSDSWQSLGSYRMDPNYGLSTGHLFLARNARQVAEPDGNDLEEIEIVLMPFADALAAAKSGDLPALGSAACLGLAAAELQRTTSR